MSWLLVAVVVATSVAAPGSPIERTFAGGETLVYNLSWMRMTGGVGRMSIAPTGEEGENYRITSVAESTSGFSKIFRFRDEIETTVARADFSTLRYVKRLDERGDKMEEVTTIEDGVATRKRLKVKKTPVPRPILDPISVIYFLRTLELTPGSRHSLTLIADGKVYTVDARILRREVIETPAGRFPTVVVEPLMVSGGEQRDEKLLVWYSDDARRIPVRIRSEVRFGAVTATLRSVESGTNQAESPVVSR